MLLNLYSRLLLKISRFKYSDFFHKSTIKKVLSLTPQEKSSRGIKRTVRLVSNFPGLWQRTIEQTPKGSCQWGGTLFLADGDADHYVILNSITKPVDSQFLPMIKLVNPSRVWGLHMEPESYIRLLGYDEPEEHSLVSRFYTNSDSLILREGIYWPSPPYVHFHSGKSWDFLNEAPVPRKKIALGIIASDLDSLDGHKARLRFLEEIDASDIDCVIWGRGNSLKRFRKYRGFALSKWDVHSICRYSIVIENCVSPWYWSEKIADALLGYSLPLYHGSQELERYLPADSFIPININQSDCIDVVRSILRNDPYEDRLPAITAARRLLLNKENLYAFLDRELESI
jgi:hypothetical protein